MNMCVDRIDAVKIEATTALKNAEAAAYTAAAHASTYSNSIGNIFFVKKSCYLVQEIFAFNCIVGLLNNSIPRVKHSFVLYLKENFS